MTDRYGKNALYQHEGPPPQSWTKELAAMTEFLTLFKFMPL
jgi:hypothetical protein